MAVMADELCSASEIDELAGDGDLAWVGLMMLVVSGTGSSIGIYRLLRILVHYLTR